MKETEIMQQQYLDLQQKKFFRSTAADDLYSALKLALEYWNHRQRRYKNRHPVWVDAALSAIAKADGKNA